MYSFSRVPMKLAAAILIEHGEISLGEIRALPLVEDEQSVLAIADLLAHNFSVAQFGRWEDGAPSCRFESVIRLLEPRERIRSRTDPTNANPSQRAERYLERQSALALRTA